MITFKLNEKWIKVRSLLKEENNLLTKKGITRQEVSEVKK